MPRKNYEETIEANRKYAKEHKDKMNENNRLWRKTSKGKEYVRRESAKYRRKYREEIIVKNQQYREKVRLEVLNHYGTSCKCCGESDIRFLTIDHIDNNGNEHRRVDNNAKNIYTWLKKHGFPDRFQVLCFNCNLAKKIYGACPHKVKLVTQPYIACNEVEARKGIDAEHSNNALHFKSAE